MYIVYRVLLGGLALLPLGVLYWLGSFLRILLQYVVKYRRKIIRKNLEVCFPEKSPLELREIEKDFYRQFSDNIVETIKLLHVSDKTIDRLVEVHNADLVNELARQKRPIVLYMGHYANWELVPSIVRYFDDSLICAQVYKPLRDKAFNRLMLKIRDRFHPVSLPQRSVFRRLVSWSREGQPFICGFLADQRPNSQVSHGEMLFLGRQTTFTPGGEEIGKRINAAYLYLEVEKPQRHRYVLTIKPITPSGEDADYPYTREYMRMLEQTIRRRPGLWLWSHRRWLFNEEKS